jgi:hypothetical protein
MAETYHVHAHLAIIKDGNMLAVPAYIGLPSCTYLTHTHDATGVIHVEADSYRLLTLGQFFQVWGEPLTSANIAGLTGETVRVFVNDDTSLVELPESEWAGIELKAHRSITIVVGEAPATIPTYVWPQGL